MIIPKIRQEELQELAWYAVHGIGIGATCSERLRDAAAKIKGDGTTQKSMEAMLDAASRLEGFEAKHGRYVIFARVFEIED